MSMPPRSRKEKRLHQAKLDELGRRIKRNRVVVPEGSSLLRVSSGTCVGVTPRRQTDEFWIRLTSAGTGTQVGYYAYTRVRGTGSSGWTDTTQAGTLAGTGTTAPAYEVNGFAAMPNDTYVRAWQDQGSQQVRFQGEFCVQPIATPVPPTMPPSNPAGQDTVPTTDTTAPPPATVNVVDGSQGTMSGVPIAALQSVIPEPP